MVTMATRGKARAARDGWLHRRQTSTCEPRSRWLQGATRGPTACPARAGPALAARPRARRGPVRGGAARAALRVGGSVRGIRAPACRTRRPEAASPLRHCGTARRDDPGRGGAPGRLARRAACPRGGCERRSGPACPSAGASWTCTTSGWARRHCRAGWSRRCTGRARAREPWIRARLADAASLLLAARLAAARAAQGRQRDRLRPAPVRRRSRGRRGRTAPPSCG